VVAVFLIVRGVSSTASLVLVPSELVSKSGAAGTLTRIRVAGRVSSQPIDYKTDPNIELKFMVDDPPGYSKGSVPVLYKGLKPEMFQSGRDVIIDGAFSNGTLEASSLLTQCPSKYEPPTPGGSATSGQANPNKPQGVN